MSNTTISKQSFKICLCQWRNCSNNHRKTSKKSLCISKRTSPNGMPMMSPKTKNCNFRQNCNPQRDTRPCTHVYIRNPKMQWSCGLFPKQTSCYKPNTKQQKLRRSSSCSIYLIFNMRQMSFSCSKINKAYSLKQQTTSKSTQLKIFHCCFKRICTFRIQTTKNNQRKTLLFHAKIERHQICCHNLHILTNQSLHCQIYIFSMTNSCNFLPSLRNSQNKSTS